jgi:hypothetical protein
MPSPLSLGIGHNSIRRRPPPGRTSVVEFGCRPAQPLASGRSGLALLLPHMVTKKKHMDVAAGRRFPATICPQESAAHGQVVDRPARGRRAAAQMLDGQVIGHKRHQRQRRGKKKNASAIVAIAFLKFGNADNSISTGIPIGGGRTTPGLGSSVVVSGLNYVVLRPSRCLFAISRNARAAGETRPPLAYAA